ncbi:MAG TPA: hypothetical protein VGR28_05360, partial [Candidatus Thermoplasmatota archaeon]|nr:hypothetical protein [Candidatus Thermoplasmatota archaeon]
MSADRAVAGRGEGPTGFRRGRVGLVVAVLLLPALSISVPPARADATSVLSAALPTARDATSAVWDGSNAYIFGGYDNVSSYLNQVARYDPSTDTLTTMTAAFPTERGWTSAVWDGSNAYIFGGYNNTASYLNQILRYNPATDTATLM